MASLEENYGELLNGMAILLDSAAGRMKEAIPAAGEGDREKLSQLLDDLKKQLEAGEKLLSTIKVRSDLREFNHHLVRSVRALILSIGRLRVTGMGTAATNYELSRAEFDKASLAMARAVGDDPTIIQTLRLTERAQNTFIGWVVVASGAEARFCDQCGFQYSQQAKFCERCGAPRR